MPTKKQPTLWKTVRRSFENHWGGVIVLTSLGVLVFVVLLTDAITGIKSVFPADSSPVAESLDSPVVEPLDSGLLRAPEDTSKTLEETRQEAELHAARERADRQAYQARYINRAAAPAELGVAISDGTRISVGLSRAMTVKLDGQPSSSFLLDASLRDGVFGRIYAGDVAEVGRLDLQQVAGTVLLGRFSVEYSESSSIRGVKSAQASLAVRLVDSSTGGILNEAASSTTALGYSQSEARQKAVDTLFEDIAAQLR